MANNFREVACAMGAAVYADALIAACDRWEIHEPLTQAHFLAQMSVESENFTDLTEDLNYRPSRLLDVFYGRNGLRTIQQAQQIVAGGYNAVAEAVYGLPWGKKLGNIHPGDGALFPGMGLKQLTGRWNFTAYSQDMYGDDRCVENPTLLLKPYDAAMSAAWYFKRFKCWNAALADNVELVTRRINPGMMALPARKVATTRAKKLFGV